MDKSVLDEKKIDAIGEIHNITMGSAAIAISNMIDATVWITTPQIKVCKAKDFISENQEISEDVYVKINYVQGIKGTSLLVLNQNDVQMIVNKMMGMPMEVSDDFEFDEIRLSAICEVMNQMMGASATALSQLLNITVDISPPEAVVSSDKSTLYKMQNIDADDDVCAITFDLTINDVIKSKFITMLSIELANAMAEKLVEVNIGSDEKPEEPQITELSPEKIDAVGEVQNIIMGSAATALSNLLSSRVTITTPKVLVTKAENISFKELEPSISVKIQYIKGIHGSSVLVLKQNDVQLMVNQILGRPLVVSDDFEFDEMNISAVCEIMNQMMGAAATTLSELINRVVDISTPEAKIVEDDRDVLRINAVEADDTVCTISFDLNIDGIMQSRFVTLLTINLANELADSMLEQYSASLESYSADNIPEETVSDGILNQDEINRMLAAAQSSSEPQPAPVPEPVPVMAAPAPKPKSAPAANHAPARQIPAPAKREPEKYQMNSFDNEKEEESFLTSKQFNNLRSLLNVPMEVSIRIGSTQKRMDEVVEFTKGTIIELDTLASEPVDVVVNGNLMAKGDVVVVDDNFAIRITEIVNSNILDTL